MEKRIFSGCKTMPAILPVIIQIIIVLLMTGCSAKESGLYQISVAEEAADTQDTPDLEDTTMSEKTSDSENMPVQEDEPEAVPEEVTLFVHICGEVQNPGVYEFESGKRIIDAVTAAGGFTEDASEDYVNLAQQLEDGMKIDIPKEGEEDTYTDAESGVTGGITKAPTISGNEVPSDGRININTAGAQELMDISGIGETRAAAIIAYRDVHGNFSSIEEITNVSGIGQTTYERIKDRITVGN